MKKDSWLLAQAKSPRRFLFIMLFALALGLIVLRWLAPMQLIFVPGVFFAVAGWAALSMGGARIVEKAILGAWGVLYPIWSATIYWAGGQVWTVELSVSEQLDRVWLSPVDSAIVGGFSMLACGVLTSVILLVVTRSIRTAVWCIVATVLASMLKNGVIGAEYQLTDLLGSMQMYWDLRSLTTFVSVLFWHGLTFWGLLSWARPRALRRAGMCVACGYDLEGSTGEKCPECGAAATSQN